MQFRLILAGLFCLTAWMNLIKATAVNNCRCVHWSETRVRLNLIKKYTIQREGLCSINAVLFHTIGGKTVCKDPNDKWVKYAMCKQEAKTTPSPKKGCHKGSTSGSTPLASTSPGITHLQTNTKDRN